MDIQFTLNRRPFQVTVTPQERLIDLLRHRCDITSVKEGCGEGECGACTIVINRQAVASCSLLAFQVNGCELITTEGLKEEGKLNDLQEAFLKYGAIQCGYCTPGMLMSVTALLLKNANPSREAIITAIEGNLCRCTGYHPIINAVESLKEAEPGDGR